MARDVYAAGRGVRERVCDAAAVADHVKSLVAGFKIFVHVHFHIVEFDLYAVEQGIVVGGAGGHLVKRVDHLDDAVQYPLGQHQAQVTRGGLQCRGDEGLVNAALGRALTADEVAEALDDHAAAQHIAQSCDRLAVAVGILKRLGEVLCHKQGKVRVLGLLRGVLVAVAVDGDDAVRVFVYHRALRVHTEGAHAVAVFLGAVDDLALVQLVGNV